MTSSAPVPFDFFYQISRFPFNFTPPTLLTGNMPQLHFDYIITGAGCAGLSLAMHLLKQPSLQQKKFLLIDATEKNTNDRTWCFWEKEPGLFEPVVCRQWDHLSFFSEAFSGTLSIAPYRYKMIRGLDFYRHCFATLKQHSNVSFHTGKVERIFSSGKKAVAVAAGETFTADYIFNSIVFEKPALRKKEVWLLQHFKGWMVETEKPFFKPAEATLMDFRVSQQHGSTFCYVLPLDEKKALVEYTLFTPALLPQEAYDKELQRYLQDFLGLQNYHVSETEFGVIPMTNHRFPKGEGTIINIGTAGGQTKGSSGYTFYFIQQQCKNIAERLANGEHPRVDDTPGRFHFYDSVLLEVLRRESVQGKKIFSTLFKKNKPQDVLAFLNNASTLSQEIRIISTLPTLPFLKAAIHQLF